MALCFLFSALIVALDQIFKQWIVRTIPLGEFGPDIIPGVLGLMHYENDGAMLNILSGQQWLLAGIAFVASVVLIMILLRYDEGFWGTLGLASVLGGTVGNLFDRIFNDGKVIDMFRTLFVQFPIFNFADVFITLGFLTFLAHFISLTIKSGNSSPETNSKSRTSHEEDEEDAAPQPEEFAQINDIVVQAQAQVQNAQVNTEPPEEYAETANIAEQEPSVVYEQADVQSVADMQATTDYQADADAAVYAQTAPAAEYAQGAPVTEHAETPATPAPVAYEPADVYSPAVIVDDDFSLDSLGIDLEGLDTDYDVDDLLREYGIDDDEYNL